MNSVQEVIDHYINQYISEECIIELNKILKNFKHESAKIDTPERRIGDRTYKTLMNRESPNSVDRELKALEDKYKNEITKIATKHAEKEDVKLIEWKDKEPEKSVAEKSEESEKNLDETQERMIDKREAFKEKIRTELKQQLAERDDNEQEQVDEKSSETDPKKEVKKDELTQEEIKEIARRQLMYELKQRDSRETERGR
ncbi:MAG: hypothetical protein JST86_00930 [Bacteroidetes bacterium]|nr:hypothetical protein [Bacteroidota bacterium]